MYADRVEVEANSRKSIRDRLNGTSTDEPSRRRQVTGKRQRQDDKWEHDLFHDDEPKLSNRKVGAQDLRLKLQRKSEAQVSQRGKESYSGVRDLREKLSGTMNTQPMRVDPPRPTLEASKPARRSVAVETPEPETKKSVNPALRKKSQQKADTSVNHFLQSLGLEKYLITFQVEEVDMAALVHMSDDDLKALGIPMGPRKKIILALESRG